MIRAYRRGVCARCGGPFIDKKCNACGAKGAHWERGSTLDDYTLEERRERGLGPLPPPDPPERRPDFDERPGTVGHANR